MLRRLKIALGASALALLACNPAWAENRVALVIGNSAYRAVAPLPNAANDAVKMSDMLGEAGFEVLSTPDLSQDDLRKTISEFAGKVAEKGPDTVALVFYAGHGIQVDGENYLVPVDVDPKREADIPVQAVRLNDILNALASVPNKMRIVMLDACRNNPFPALRQSVGKGLALVDTKSGATGTFISYSTSPGSEAEDGTGANSPYTTALLNVAKEPGLSIEEAFKRVRVSVNETTQGRQVPWESSSLTSDFRFHAKADTAAAASPAETAPAAAAPASPAVPRVTRSVDDWKRDLQGKEPKAAYDLVIAGDSVEGYEAYVALFAQPPLGTRVKVLLDKRKEMIAWDSAVIVNTAASYRLFATSFPGSDLVATARKLEERMRNRSINANAAMLPVPVANATPAPTNVALAPATCPCNAAPTQRAEPKQTPKRAEPKAKNRRVDAPPPRRRAVVEEEVIVYQRPPPPPPIYVGPRPYYGGGGISIGGGGYRPGGGYGPRPAPMQSAPPMTGRSVYR